MTKRGEVVQTQIVQGEHEAKKWQQGELRLGSAGSVVGDQTRNVSHGYFLR